MAKGLDHDLQCYRPRSFVRYALVSYIEIIHTSRLFGCCTHLPLPSRPNHYGCNFWNCFFFEWFTDGFSSRNYVWQRIFVIVPFLPDNASSEDIQRWHSNEPKRYKTRVINKEDNGMKNYIATKGRVWNDIDDEEVIFLSDHRPRARYFYFHYCVTMLRRSWTAVPTNNVLNDELGRRFWGTSGRYLQKTMLLALMKWDISMMHC